MTVFIDYYVVDKEVLTIAIREENGTFKSFGQSQFADVIQFLMGTEPVVSWKRSIMNITKALQDYKMYMDDSELRKRWIDLHRVISLETEQTTSLKNVAKSTLGLGPQSDIPRLKQDIDPIYRSDVIPQMENKLDVLQQIYDYLILHGQLSFVKNSETIWAEIDVNENPLHSDV